MATTGQRFLAELQELCRRHTVRLGAADDTLVITPCSTPDLTLACAAIRDDTPQTPGPGRVRDPSSVLHPYLLFAGICGAAQGGWKDFVGDYATIDAARGQAFAWQLPQPAYRWWHIMHSITGICLERYEGRGCTPEEKHGGGLWYSGHGGE